VPAKVRSNDLGFELFVDIQLLEPPVFFFQFFHPGHQQCVSDHPDFAQWLAGMGISSISLNPDTVVETWKLLAG
jgi:hypothetical protein